MKLFDELLNDHSYIMDEMVFEQRNKAYGAYQLRRDYDKTMVRSFLITLSMFLLLAAFRFLPEDPKQIVIPDVRPERDTLFREVIFPPDEPPMEQNNNSGSNSNVIPQVVSTPVPPDDSSDLDKDTSTVLYAGKGNGSNPNHDPGPGKGDPGGSGNGTSPSSNTVINYADTMPEFPGGYAALMRYITDNLQYPTHAIGAGASGRVMVKFYIGTDGSVNDVHVAGSSPGYGMDEEAMRVVREMPKWKAGSQNDRKVNVWMVLPIRFELN